MRFARLQGALLEGACGCLWSRCMCQRECGRSPCPSAPLPPLAPLPSPKQHAMPSFTIIIIPPVSFILRQRQSARPRTSPGHQLFMVSHALPNVRANLAAWVVTEAILGWSASAGSGSLFKQSGLKEQYYCIAIDRKRRILRTRQARTRSMPERRKCSVAYSAMVRSKALRMWSWLSICFIVTWLLSMRGKYRSMSSKICTPSHQLKISSEWSSN